MVLKTTLNKYIIESFYLKIHCMNIKIILKQNFGKNKIEKGLKRN